MNCEPLIIMFILPIVDNVAQMVRHMNYEFKGHEVGRKVRIALVTFFHNAAEIS